MPVLFPIFCFLDEWSSMETKGKRTPLFIPRLHASDSLARLHNLFSNCLASESEVSCSLMKRVTDEYPPSNYESKTSKSLEPSSEHEKDKGVNRSLLPGSLGGLVMDSDMPGWMGCELTVSMPGFLTRCQLTTHPTGIISSVHYLLQACFSSSTSIHQARAGLLISLLSLPARVDG